MKGNHWIEMVYADSLGQVRSHSVRDGAERKKQLVF